MRRLGALLALAALAAGAAAQERVIETRELIGQLGSRDTLLVLYATRVPNQDSWKVTGEYVVLATLVRRYLEGERSPKLGVTTLKEGVTPILFGRPPTATLQGTWRDGRFSGARFAPGGQEREKFEFSEKFPELTGYSAEVRCNGSAERYEWSLAYAIGEGRLRAGSLEWRSRVAPSGHNCAIDASDAIEPQRIAGALRFAVGPAAASGERCTVTLRQLGEYVRVSAEQCGSQCGSRAHLEPVLVTGRGGCELFRPQTR